MNFLLRLLLLSAVFTFFSCDYGPSGEHIEDVKPVREVKAKITLSDAQDTIKVRGDVYLYYHLSVPDRTYHGYQMKLGATVLQEGNSPSGYHIFESEKYSDGYHKLQLSAIVNSGTGSLADKHGAEIAETYRTWVVYIDNSPPKPVSITSIAPHKGSLRIEWEPYKGMSFEGYGLMKYVKDHGTERLAYFKDPGQTWFIDDSYVGGEVSYHVVVYTDDKYSVTSGKESAYHFPLPHILKYTFDENRNLSFTFSSTPFYKNFKEYHISSTPIGIGAYTTERTDTTVTVNNIGFGSDFDVTIMTVPQIRDPGIGGRVLESENKIEGYGTAWGPYEVQNLIRRPQTDRFYAVEANSLKVIDASTLQVKQKRVTGQPNEVGLTRTVVSEDGKLIYSILNGKLHRLDPETLQTLETFAIQNLIPGYNDSDFIIEGVSNTNRLLVVPFNPADFVLMVHVVDMEQQELVHIQATNYFPTYAQISPNGKGIIVDHTIYLEQEVGEWKAVTGDYGSVFHPSKPWYGRMRGSTLTFYNMVTGNQEKSITLSGIDNVRAENPEPLEAENSGYRIDAGSGYLYWVTDDTYENRLFIYNIETGKMVRKLELAESAKAFVYKDRIYSGYRYIKL